MGWSIERSTWPRRCQTDPPGYWEGLQGARRRRVRAAPTSLRARASSAARSGREGKSKSSLRDARGCTHGARERAAPHRSLASVRRLAPSAADECIAPAARQLCGPALHHLGGVGYANCLAHTRIRKVSLSGKLEVQCVIVLSDCDSEAKCDWTVRKTPSSTTST